MTDTLTDWRKEIDALDEQLMQILSKRMDIVRKVGKHKKENQIPPLDEARWQEVLETKLAKANILNLSKSFILKLYNTIHEYALEIERNI